MVLKSEKYLDLRIIKTRKKIKTAMIHLMSKENYAAITINSIVKHANVNRSSFYNHYANKDELLEDLLEEIVSDLIDSYRMPYTDMKTFKLNDLSPRTIVLFQNVYKHRDFYRMIVQSDIIFRFQRKLTNEIKNIFLKELKLAHPKINQEVNSAYHAYALVGTIIDWVENGFKYSPDYMAEQLVEIITMPSDQSLIVLKNK
jgi:AcrR family transcriptional regulator